MINRFFELPNKPLKRSVIFNWLLLSLLISLAIGTFIASYTKLITPSHAETFLDIICAWLFMGLTSMIIFLSSFLFFEVKQNIRRMAYLFLSIILGTSIGLGLYYYIWFNCGRVAEAPTYIETLKAVGFSSRVFYYFTLQCAVYTVFLHFEPVLETQEDLDQATLNRVHFEHQAETAKLKLLRAQIEPHFLFNTLANILNLFETNPVKGIKMQEDLIQYLQSGLVKIQTEVTTLGQEIEMIKAYLNIFKVRMGDRLNYDITIPEELKEMTIPPMLIQPLVENAIKHGLEPKLEGGEIKIRTEKSENLLKLEITDTGVGLKINSKMNVGISNIRERLKALYGQKARLILEENNPCGLRAIIEFAYV